jgi:signal transduction histidine kinase
VSLLLDGSAGPLTAAQREYVEYVRDACGQMTMHVDDLLDLTRVETGKLTLRLRVGTMDGVLRQALRPFLRAAGLRNVRMRVDVPSGLPPVVFDAPRIVQVLANLLGNALKFTLPFGEIAVRARHDRAQGCVVVAVADTGEGIATEALPRVFERAYQAAEDGHREGLGLGLAIAREIVLLHGGRIQAESVPGRGSTFSFTLPVATSSAGVPGDSDPAREAQP